jgi:hypothetical protein
MSHRVDWEIVIGLLPPSSGSSSPKTVVFLDCPTLNKESEFCLKTAVIIYQLSDRHIPKNLEFLSTRLWETETLAVYRLLHANSLVRCFQIFRLKLPEFITHFACGIFLVIYCIHGCKGSNSNIHAPYEIDPKTVLQWCPMRNTTPIYK